MPSLYNCRHDGDQYRITKLDSDWNVEASYLCDETACECPAGHRPSCRHRQMLPKFIQREHIGDEWFFDFDRGGWVQGASKDLEPAMIIEPKTFNEVSHEHDNEQLAFYRLAAEQKANMDFTKAGGTITTHYMRDGSINTFKTIDHESGPAGLGQASEQRPSTNQTITYTSEGSPPLASRTTIRRRV